jgi:hypothetical protein
VQKAGVVVGDVWDMGASLARAIRMAMRAAAHQPRFGSIMTARSCIGISFRASAPVEGGEAPLLYAPGEAPAVIDQ